MTFSLREGYFMVLREPNLKYFSLIFFFFKLKHKEVEDYLVFAKINK